MTEKQAMWGQFYEAKPKKQMTMREHFAAVAMQGLVASEVSKGRDLDPIAINAVKIADRLLKELAK